MTKKTNVPGETPEPRESELDRGGGGSPGPAPDPEVTPRAQRRRFSAAYKLRIVQRADGCSRPGEIGALLRRRAFSFAA